MGLMTEGVNDLMEQQGANKWGCFENGMSTSGGALVLGRVTS